MFSAVPTLGCRLVNERSGSTELPSLSLVTNSAICPAHGRAAASPDRCALIQSGAARRGLQWTLLRLLNKRAPYCAAKGG